MQHARRSCDDPGLAMHDVLLVEQVDGDGGGGVKGTTGAGQKFGGPRSMAAAILSRLEAMRLRGRSNIATPSRPALIPCRIPDSSCSSQNRFAGAAGTGGIPV